MVLFRIPLSSISHHAPHIKHNASHIQHKTQHIKIAQCYTFLKILWLWYVWEIVRLNNCGNLITIPIFKLCPKNPSYYIKDHVSYVKKITNCTQYFTHVGTPKCYMFLNLLTLFILLDWLVRSRLPSITLYPIHHAKNIIVFCLLSYVFVLCDFLIW